MHERSRLLASKSRNSFISMSKRIDGNPSGEVQVAPCRLFPLHINRFRVQIEALAMREYHWRADIRAQCRLSEPCELIIQLRTSRYACIIRMSGCKIAGACLSSCTRVPAERARESLPHCGHPRAYHGVNVNFHKMTRVEQQLWVCSCQNLIT